MEYSWSDLLFLQQLYYIYYLSSITSYKYFGSCCLIMSTGLYPNLQQLITCLLLILEAWDIKRTFREQWAETLFIWSYLTFGPLLQGQMRVVKLLVLEVRDEKTNPVGNHGLGFF